MKYSLKLSTPPHYTQFYAIYFHHFVSEESTVNMSVMMDVNTAFWFFSMEIISPDLRPIFGPQLATKTHHHSFFFHMVFSILIPTKCFHFLFIKKVKSYGVKHHFQQYFGYIMAVSIICGGNLSTHRKPLTCCKSLTNLIT